MIFFLLFFMLPGYHWEDYPQMNVWYLRRESDHAEIGACFTRPKQAGMYGKLTNTSDDPTHYADLQACESDLESKVN